MTNQVSPDLADFVRCNLPLNGCVLFGSDNICVAVFDNGGEIAYWVVRRDGKEIVATMPSAQRVKDNLENMQNIFELALSEGGQ